MSKLILLKPGTVKEVCKIGKGSECCSFLVCGSKGFECTKGDERMAIEITARVLNGTFTAKGQGGGKGCVHSEIGKED